MKYCGNEWKMGLTKEEIKQKEKENDLENLIELVRSQGMWKKLLEKCEKEIEELKKKINEGR